MGNQFTDIKLQLHQKRGFVLLYYGVCYRWALSAWCLQALEPGRESPCNLFP